MLNPAASSQHIPLVVDLDGTLLRTDTLWESLLILAKRRWTALFLLPFWLLEGKAAFKWRIAEAIELPTATLPQQEAFVAHLRQVRAEGRTLVLATAATEKIARSVARDFDLFDHVLASDERTNLSGSRKLAAIRALLGEVEFDYAGNDRADLPIWRAARRAILVDPTRAAAAGAPALTTVEATFASPGGGIGAHLRGLRPQQWAKNVLVFLPLFAAHRATEMELVGKALLAFASWCLCASAVYVLNDLFDLAADREHPTKRSRPFASGVVPIPRALAMIPLLLAASAWLALAVGIPLFLLVALYLVINVAYSGFIKRIMLLDVVVLAGVYTLRVISGAAAVDVRPSFWLLAFSMFMFFDLALIKRYADLVVLQSAGKTELGGRDYQVRDLPLLLSLGSTSGLMAVLVLALYVNSPEIEVMYRRPELVWLLCPILLYWTARIWMKAVRSEMPTDPLVYALRDRASWILGVLCVVVLWSAL